MFDGNGYDGLRRVIDIPGDGPNNSGRPLPAARSAALAAGLPVNGLPTMKDRNLPVALRPPNAHRFNLYFRQNVLGGEWAFPLTGKGLDARVQERLVGKVLVKTGQN